MPWITALALRAGDRLFWAQRERAADRQRVVVVPQACAAHDVVEVQVAAGGEDLAGRPAALGARGEGVGQALVVARGARGAVRGGPGGGPRPPARLFHFCAGTGPRLHLGVAARAGP